MTIITRFPIPCPPYSSGTDMPKYPRVRLVSSAKAWCTFTGRANVIPLLARTDPVAAPSSCWWERRRPADPRSGARGLSIHTPSSDPKESPDAMLVPPPEEIDIGAVDHEKRGLRVAVKVVRERLRQPLQVLRPDPALEVAGALAEPTEQHLRSSLEIDDGVRPREPLIEHLEDPLVELEFVGVEGEPGEDGVLREQVVRTVPCVKTSSCPS